MKLIDKLIDRKNEPVERKSLLPNNATPLERAVEGTHARLDQVPVPINDLYSPQRIPGELIPFMAWSVALNDYSEDWSDAVKRSLIENSYELHAHKGTKWAMVHALELIGIKADFSEWYQYGGLPYHFSIVLNGDEQSQQLTEQFFYDLFRTVYDKKNARSWLNTLEINRESDLSLYFGIGVVQSSYQTVGIYKYADQTFDLELYYRPGFAGRQNRIFYHEQPDKNFGHTFTTGSWFAKRKRTIMRHQ